MTTKNNVALLAVIVLFSSCNYQLFTKNENILKHATGFMLEYKGSYFFYKCNFENHLDIDQDYMFEKVKRKAIVVEEFDRREEIDFYERTKCLAPLFLNLQDIENDSLKVNFIDTIRLVPVTLNYFIDKRPITEKKAYEYGYNRFYILKDLDHKKSRQFDYEKNYRFKNNSFKINFEVIRLRPQDSVCIFQ